MKIWFLYQNENCGWDTYDSIVVAAETEAEARLIMPNEHHKWTDCNNDSWASDPANVKVELPGEAVPGTEAGVILASFNAG